jgi:GxxExxY protein
MAEHVVDNHTHGMRDVPSEWNRITETIIASAIGVHSLPGPGLLERLYEEAMVYECTRRGLGVKRQVSINLAYKDISLGEQVLDLVVDDLVVVELKSVKAVLDVHTRQLVSYMKSAKLPLGLLINFNVSRLKDGLHRRVLTRQTPVPSSFLT